MPTLRQAAEAWFFFADGSAPAAPDLLAAIYGMLGAATGLGELTGVYDDLVPDGTKYPYLQFTMDAESLPGETLEHISTTVDFDLYATDFDDAKRLGDLMADWVDPVKSHRARMAWIGGVEVACLRERAAIETLPGRDRLSRKLFAYTVRFEVHCEREYT